MSSDVVISVQNVSKVYQIYHSAQDRFKQMIVGSRRQLYDEFWALRDINFEVKKGETVGIVGRNGSGKSTLLQIICGTITPTTGMVDRKGRLSALLELGSGFNMEFTGRENIYLNGALLGLSKSEMDARLDKILAFADIGAFIDSPVKNYSSGMFARLAFSVAIHVDPEILIVDEILAVGDAAFQRKCLGKFYELRDSGCSILFVSHDQYQVKSTCQRALYIDRGVQKIFGPADRVIDQYMIEMESRESAVSQGSDVEPMDVDQEEKNIDHVFKITEVRLVNEKNEPIDVVTTGETIKLQFEFVSLVSTPPEKISFVFNLYRHDGQYMCGSTTLMDGVQPYTGGNKGRLEVAFPQFPLLSGQYKWRVAINDHIGLLTYAEAKEVCHFQVRDNFNAVGVVDIPRRWSFELIH